MPSAAEVGAAIGELRDRLAHEDAAAEGDLDVVGVAPTASHARAEDVELVAQRRTTVGNIEQVAGVGVAGDERQGPPFAHAADEHPWSRTGARNVYRLLEPMVGAVERCAVAVPHVGGQLQQLFESAESFRGWLERGRPSRASSAR